MWAVLEGWGGSHLPHQRDVEKPTHSMHRDRTHSVHEGRTHRVHEDAQGARVKDKRWVSSGWTYFVPLEWSFMKHMPTPSLPDQLQLVCWVVDLSHYAVIGCFLPPFSMSSLRLKTWLLQYSQHGSVLITLQRQKGTNGSHPIHLEIKCVKYKSGWAGNKLETV